MRQGHYTYSACMIRCSLLRDAKFRRYGLVYLIAKSLKDQMIGSLFRIGQSQIEMEETQTHDVSFT